MFLILLRVLHISYRKEGCSTTVIDTSLFAEIITMIESILGLFSIYPLNVLVLGMVVGVAFKVIRGAKGAAK